MQNLPRIAVLIPAYNAEETIRNALNSLEANAEPHDVVIVDDGSRVPLKDILEPRPNRTTLRPERNLGIAGACNFGLRHIFDRGYEFVARLDADDAAMPDRLAKQREFMDRHPEVALLGGWARFVSEKGETLFYASPPTSHDEIVTSLYYNNCFCHSTLMMRADVLQRCGGYSELYPSLVEDYELAFRIARVAKVANLPDYLIDYTVSPRCISVRKRRQLLGERLKIQWSHRNFSNIHSCLGLGKTLALCVLPFSLITSTKRRIKKKLPSR